MSKFPDTFRANVSQEELKRNAAASQEASSLREYIQERAAAFMNKKLPYFLLYIKDYPPLVREVVMIELQERFPDIGYRAMTDELAMQMIFNNFLGKQVDEKKMVYQVKRIKESSDFYNNDSFMVAITTEFGKTLEQQRW